MFCRVRGVFENSRKAFFYSFNPHWAKQLDAETRTWQRNSVIGRPCNSRRRSDHNVLYRVQLVDNRKLGEMGRADTWTMPN
jgi:hypothetical protein